MSEVKTNKISSLASNNDITLDPDGSGSVAITNSGSSNALEIETNISTYEVQFTGSSHANITANVGTNPLYIQNLGAGTMNFQTAATDRMVINASGNIGMGVANPTQRLHIDEPTSNNQAIIINSSLSTFQGQVLNVQCDRNTSNNSYNLCLMGADRFVVRDSGNVKNVNNSYGALSDSRSKENIKDAGSQWNDIKALQVRNYNLIGSDLTQIGVVSQEVEAAGMSGLVEEAKLSKPDENGNDIIRKNVKYSVLYMKAVKALQEAMTRIETLETKVAALEAGK